METTWREENIYPASAIRSIGSTIISVALKADRGSCACLWKMVADGESHYWLKLVSPTLNKKHYGRGAQFAIAAVAWLEVVHCT